MPDSYLLFASLLALGIGPLLHQLGRSGNEALLPILDGFVFVSIGGLVLLHILPEGVRRVICTLPVDPSGHVSCATWFRRFDTPVTGLHGFRRESSSCRS